MNKRKTAIEHMKIAGYNNDRHAWVRLYAEHRIGFEIAESAWREGQRKFYREQEDEKSTTNIG